MSDQVETFYDCKADDATSPESAANGEESSAATKETKEEEKTAKSEAKSEAKKKTTKRSKTSNTTDNILNYLKLEVVPRLDKFQKAVPERLDKVNETMKNIYDLQNFKSDESEKKDSVSHNTGYKVNKEGKVSRQKSHTDRVSALSSRLFGEH